MLALIEDTIFEKAWDFLTGKIGGALEPFFEWLYLLQWYWWGGLIIIACLLVALFSPWAWPKKAAAWVFSLAVTAITVATIVFNRMRKKKKPAEPQEPPPQERDDRPWRW